RNKRERERERESFPLKSSKAQPGPLTEQRTERILQESQPAADRPLSLLEAERQMGDSKSRKARGNLAPETASPTKL
ncbi:unnamed protein product, partial [Rangifer tarandus platyrhynchus]